MYICQLLQGDEMDHKWEQVVTVAMDLFVNYQQYQGLGHFHFQQIGIVPSNIEKQLLTYLAIATTEGVGPI